MAEPGFPGYTPRPGLTVAMEPLPEPSAAVKCAFEADVKRRVFVSWSGERSKAIAEALAEWLPHVLQSINPWISTNLQKGDRWADVIGKKLAESDIGLICVTPENMSSSWLSFEAGAISKVIGEAKVCPVLLGIRHADLEGPLAQFQTTVLDRSDMLALIRSLNDSLESDGVASAILDKAFDRTWPEFEQRVSLAAKIRIGSENVRHVLSAFAKFGLPEPSLGSTAFFREGFESHAIYETAMTVAQSRLYVFGRKNRKVFDKDHAMFFKSLGSRVGQGFDFKCLFLDPQAPPSVLSAAHADSNFGDQLTSSMRQARDVMTQNGLDLSTHCRMYKTHRAHAYVVIDDAVAYAPIRFGVKGPVPLTKCGFTVVNASSDMGQDLVNEFQELFESATAISGDRN